MDNITNYERIKNMSVEEMAKWITGVRFVYECNAHGKDANLLLKSLDDKTKLELGKWFEDSIKEQKQWLNSEVDDG